MGRFLSSIRFHRPHSVGLFASLLLSSGVFLHSQAPALHVMPLPRSVQLGSGGCRLMDISAAALRGSTMRGWMRHLIAF